MKIKTIAALLVGTFVSLASMQQAYALDFMWEDDVFTMCEEICEPYHISPNFVMAVIWKESRFATDAENGPCKGLMQVKESCHKERMERLGVTDLSNPYENIQVGVDYLAELFETYEDDAIVLDMYNGNTKAISNYEKGKLSSYSKSVLEKAVDYEWRYLYDNGICNDRDINRIRNICASSNECN